MSSKTRNENAGPCHNKTAKQRFIAELKSLAQSQGVNQVFTTFLELTALCLSIETDPTSKSERLQRYNDMVRDMDDETLNAYARMEIALIEEAQRTKDCPYDVLGEIFMSLGLSNEWNGQFFTPDNICRMMAKLVGVDSLPEKGSITINEPTCGSGAMVLGAVYAMKEKGQDFQSHAMFVAQDIDIRCVWMTYIQLWLYEIPAIVIHGDTLAMKEWSRWYTPFVTYVEPAESPTQYETSSCDLKEAQVG